MDNPKSLDERIKSDPRAAIQSELAEIKAEKDQSSYLRQAIDFLSEPYHHHAAAVQKLEVAARELDQPDLPGTLRSQNIARQAIQQMESSRQDEWDTYRIVSGAAKTAGTFIPGKYGLLAAGTVYALDAAGSAGSGGTETCWGFAKGLAMRGAVSQISRGRGGPALMSLELGLANRTIDTALTPTTYLDSKSGEASLGSIAGGLLKSGKDALNPVALGSDVVTAGLAQGMLKVLPQQLAGNTFRAMTTMTFARGYASGLSEEAQDQYHKGQFSAARLAAYPIASALSQTLAAAPGNQRLYVRNWPMENALTIRELDYKLVSIASSDVKAITSSGGRPVQATVKPIGDNLTPGQAETLSISRANVPTDWISAALKSVNPLAKTQAATEEMRFVSRPRGDENAAWQMVVNRGTKTVSELMQQNSSFYHRETIAPFLKNFNEPATRFLGSGSESGAFQLANGAVLKLSSLNGPEKVGDWGNLPHDSRVLFRPVLFGKEPNPYNHNIISTASSLLLQEPLRTPVSEAQAAALRKDMDKAGVSFWDYNYRLSGDQVSSATEQVGIDATGRTVMLDYGARRAAGSRSYPKI
ncbi:MAG: hypothetical protein JST01_07945 [Cyanobacteria bacterium SZAS TMP-1]|nr:hypothetical protein [Cyanobacteria bacterium SZAS TMP-1]